MSAITEILLFFGGLVQFILLLVIAVNVSNARRNLQELYRLKKMEMEQKH